MMMKIHKLLLLGVKFLYEKNKVKNKNVAGVIYLYYFKVHG